MLYVQQTVVGAIKLGYIDGFGAVDMESEQEVNKPSQVLRSAKNEGGAAKGNTVW